MEIIQLNEQNIDVYLKQLVNIYETHNVFLDIIESTNGIVKNVEDGLLRLVCVKESNIFILVDEDGKVAQVAVTRYSDTGYDLDSCSHIVDDFDSFLKDIMLIYHDDADLNNINYDCLGEMN